MAEIIIGARGWNHAGWYGHYYPDDLPLDWKLAYYANEYQVVLVPNEQWLNAGNDCFEQWLYDTDDGFRFFLEVAGKACQKADVHTLGRVLSNVTTILGERFEGILVHQLLIEGDNREIYLNYLGAYPFHLLPGEEKSLSTQPTFAGRDSAWVWRPGMPAKDDYHGMAGLVTALPDDLPRLRQHIEAFQVFAGNRTTAYLFIDGDPPSSQAMQDAGIIVDLLAG